MSKLVKKYFSFSIGSYFAAVINIFLVPVLTWLILPDELGKSSMFILAHKILLTIMLMGLDASFMRVFYEKDDLTQKAIIFKAINYSVVLLLLTFIISVNFYKEITSYLFENYSLKVFIMLFVAVLFSIIYRYVFLVLRMQQKGIHCSILNFVQALLNTSIAIFLTMFVSKSYDSIVIAYILSIFGSMLTGFYFSRKYWISLLKNFRKIHISFKNLFLYGLPFIPSQILYFVFESTDKIFIRSLCSFEDLGIYSVGFKIVGALKIIQTTFQTFWIPVAFEKFEKEDNKYFYKKVANLMTFIMFFFAYMVVFSKNIIIKIISAEYSNAVFVIPFLLLVPVMNILSEITVVGINFAKKTYWHVVITLIVLIVNIVSNYIFIKAYGIWGASISIGFSYIVFFILRSHIADKYYKYGINWIKIYSSVLLFIATCILDYSGFKYQQIIPFVVFVFIYKNEIIDNFKKIKKVVRG